VELNGKVQQNLMIEKTNDGQCLKDDKTFAFLAKVLPHIVARSNVILQGAPIGLHDQSKSSSELIH
jgi:hypothetical protein